MLAFRPNIAFLLLFSCVSPLVTYRMPDPFVRWPRVRWDYRHCCLITIPRLPDRNSDEDETKGYLYHLRQLLSYVIKFELCRETLLDVAGNADKSEHDFRLKDFINTVIPESGLTLLHYAVASGSRTSVRILLDCGAEPNMVNVPVKVRSALCLFPPSARRVTPLFIALCLGLKRVVFDLVDAGADLVPAWAAEGHGLLVHPWTLCRGDQGLTESLTFDNKNTMPISLCSYRAVMGQRFCLHYDWAYHYWQFAPAETTVSFINTILPRLVPCTSLSERVYKAMIYQLVACCVGPEYFSARLTDAHGKVQQHIKDKELQFVGTACLAGWHHDHVALMYTLCRQLVQQNAGACVSQPLESGTQEDSLFTRYVTHRYGTPVTYTCYGPDSGPCPSADKTTRDLCSCDSHHRIFCVPTSIVCEQCCNHLAQNGHLRHGFAMDPIHEDSEPDLSRHHRVWSLSQLCLMPVIIIYVMKCLQHGRTLTDEEFPEAKLYSSGEVAWFRSVKQIPLADGRLHDGPTCHHARLSSEQKKTSLRMCTRSGSVLEHLKTLSRYEVLRHLPLSSTLTAIEELRLPPSLTEFLMFG